MSAPHPPRPADGAPAPGADAAAWLRALRPRVAALRAAAPGAAAPDAAALLRQAAAQAEVGTRLPSLAHLGPLRRAIAARLGRLLLYFLRLLSVDQSRFNQLAVRALGELGEHAERGARAAAAAHAAATEAAAAARRGLAAGEARHAELAARHADLAARHAELAARLDDLAARQAAALAALDAEHTTTRSQQQALLDAVAELRRATSALRAQTEVLRRRGDAPPPDATPSDAPAAAAASGGALDAFMVAAAFRGDEAELRERQRRYVELFAGRANVLDVGCGRGEFLELLRDAGVAARGLDADRHMALWCQEKGLDVTCADALTALAQLPPGSLGGIFCAQVVEHLVTGDMLRFVELAARALAPDGILVVETLNPESLLVLYRWYWVDLTHQRLVHPEALRTVFEAAGLRDIEVRFVQPPEGAVRLPLLDLPGVEGAALADFNRATQYLNDLLYGSFDYAVIGVR